MATLHFSVEVRNAMLDGYEVLVGTTPILEILAGTAPGDTLSADANTVLATLNLPSDWMNDASGGVKTLKGTWEDASADASGTATHYRLWDSTHTKCHEQGDITATGGVGAMTLDNIVLAAGQDFKVTSHSFTAANA